VEHVVGRTFTVAGLDATVTRSTGRSEPVRRAAGAFGSVTYVAVAAGSGRARDVLGTAARRDREAEASPGGMRGLRPAAGKTGGGGRGAAALEEDD
jgi:hypothetical protein